MNRFFQSSAQKRSAELKSALCAICATFAVLAVLPSGNMSEGASRADTDKVELLPLPDKADAAANTTASTENPAVGNLSAALPDLNYPQAGFPAESALPFSEIALSSERSFAPQISGLGEFRQEAAAVETFDFGLLDKIPRRLSKVRINYPAEMLRRGLEGEVKLSVIIDKDGTARVEKVLSATAPAFEKSALDATKGLLYEVPTKGGKPVRARFTLPIPFRISK